MVDRAELNGDFSWSEYGDCYMLKLFRDYVFHQVCVTVHKLPNSNFNLITIAFGLSPPQLEIWSVHFTIKVTLNRKDVSLFKMKVTSSSSQSCIYMKPVKCLLPSMLTFSRLILLLLSSFLDLTFFETKLVSKSPFSMLPYLILTFFSE